MRRKSILAIGSAAVLIAALPAFSQSSATTDQMQVHARQAQEYLKSNRPDLAVREFSAMVALDPNNLDARGNLGVLLFFQGEFAEAAQQLRAALQLQPTLWKMQALLGMCEKRIGQTANAQVDLEKSFPQLAEEKIRVQTGMELIEIYYEAGALDKAAAIVSTLHQLEPSNIDILYTAHRIYSDLADESMLSIAMLAPDSARMHQVMAHEAARQGNTQGAIAQYREALKLDPKIPGLHFELAEALNGSELPGDRQEVERQYKAALTVNPFDEKSECRLGDIAARQSDLKAAAAHYSRALKLQPNDADANLGLAKILMSMHQPQEAEAHLEHAAELDPFNPAHYRLGVLYRELGRTSDSQRELAEFEKLKKMKIRLSNIYQECVYKPESATKRPREFRNRVLRSQ